MDEPLSEQQRREIAGRARTLHERFDGPSNVRETEPPIAPDRIVAEWKARFPSEAAFVERLEADGLTEESVREQVTRTCWPPDVALPDWIDELESLIRHVESSDPTDLHAPTVDEDRPFAELIRAVVGYARERLPAETVPTDRASSTEEWLATRLEHVTVRPLYVEFKSYVEQHDPEIARADPDEFDDPPTEYYERFVDAVFDGGFSNVCVEYPVLARHLVRLVDYWVEAVTELWRRLRSDESVLRERFDVEGEVVDVEPLAEDPHARGRVPARVSFETGSVIYKPRPVDGERAFYTVLSRLDDHLSVPSFRSPTFVRCENYGWMEVVEYRDADEASGVTRYYERAGAVLCLAYALNFTDVQLENVLASGEHPMVVDGETLFHPDVDPEALPYNAQVAALKMRSVLFTALLPFSVNHPDERDIGHVGTMIAGFGDGRERSVSGLTMPEIEAVNTDVMSVGKQEMSFDSSTNTPAIGGEARPPEEYVDAILRGFERTYATLRDLHADGLLFSEVVDPELVEGIENRFIFRPTIRYVSVLLSATGRDVLREGARFTVEMERLAAPFFDDTVSDRRLWPAYEAERKAIRRLDVPRFSSRPDEVAVFHDGSELGIETNEAGYERSKRRVAALSEDDRRRQAWLIRQSLSDDLPTDPPPRSAAETHDDRLRREAVELFDRVVDARVETPEREEWLSMFRLTDGFSVCPVDDSLYAGRSGIALTAAALYGTTDREEYREVAAEAIDPVVDALEADSRSFGLGGYQGVGSVVYALSVIADLLDDSTYREQALAATRLMSDERIAADDDLDVMSGSAGALLGLLAYHDRYGGDAVLDRAVACGDHLLDARVEVSGHRVWNEFTGFAHGSAGIAYALARLGAVTDDARYFGAVREALEFESETYSPDRRNWTKYRGGEEYTDRWCHGRSGIVLARLGMSEYLPDGTLPSDTRDALSAIPAAEASSVDHLCCGNLGRVETLLVGSRRADADPSDARELLGRCLARKEREGALNLNTHSPAFVNPELFKGACGAVYTLLRASNPDALPSLLLLE